MVDKKTAVMVVWENTEGKLTTSVGFEIDHDEHITTLAGHLEENNCTELVTDVIQEIPTRNIVDKIPLRANTRRT
jgi:hypothetical protein